MIRINDDWVIDVDEHNYILKRDLHKISPKKQKNGTYKDTNVFDIVGYHPTMSKALDRLGEEIIRGRLKGAEMGLNEAVQAIRKCTAEWRELVKLVKDSTGENHND